MYVFDKICKKLSTPAAFRNSLMGSLEAFRNSFNLALAALCTIDISSKLFHGRCYKIFLGTMRQNNLKTVSNPMESTVFLIEPKIKSSSW
jgi:hypothetical protein